MRFHHLLLPLLLSLAACAGEPAAQRGGDEPAAGERAAPGGSDAAAEAPEARARTILMLGNSLTAGYGLEPEQAFPSLVQQKIDSAGWNYRVVNAGLSGETSAGGLRRIDWLLQQPVDVLVLELGANDGLRGLPVDQIERNLQGIMERARAKNPDVRIVLAGMMVPPNLGGDYARDFSAVFPRLADRNDAVLIPFLLEGVGGVRDLNQPDGIHPTARGQEIVAETVWNALEPVLEELHAEA